jgi:hypothetical protein
MCCDIAEPFGAPGIMYEGMSSTRLLLQLLKGALFLLKLLLNRLSLYCFVLSLVLRLRTTASEVGAAEDLS